MQSIKHKILTVIVRLTNFQQNVTSLETDYYIAIEFLHLSIKVTRTRNIFMDKIWFHLFD